MKEDNHEEDEKVLRKGRVKKMLQSKMKKVI